MRVSSPPLSAAGRALLALLLAAVLLLAAACSGDDDSGGDPVADPEEAGGITSFIPAGSPGYFEIDVDLEGEQWTQIDELGELFPAYPEFRQELEESIMEEEDGEVTFEEVQAVLGDRAGIAVTEIPAGLAEDLELGDPTADSPDPSFIAVVELAEGQEDATRELLMRDGELSPAGEAEGVEILTDGDDTFIAITQSVLVFGETQEDVAAALAANAAGGEATLAGEERYTSALNELPEVTFAEGYFDLGAIIAEVAASSPELQQLGALGDYEDTVVALSIAAESEGIRIEGVVTGAPDEATGEGFTPELLERVPADAFAYVGLNDLASSVGGTLGGLEGEVGAQLQQQIEFLSAQLESQLGVTVDDLAALTSGEHAFIVGGDAMTPAFVAVLGVEDGARAQATLDSLREATPLLAGMLGAPPGALEFQPIELENGVEGFELPISSQFSVVYGVDGELAIIGSNDQIVRQIQTPGDALPDSETFQAGTEGLPDQISGIVWINAESILEAVEQAGLLDDADAEVIANVEPIKSIAAWGESGDTPSFTLFVRIAE